MVAPRTTPRIVVSAIALIASTPLALAAQARISEETRIIETYPFSEPNPVPILARDRRLYPYHSFEGYAHRSEPRAWKVVKLENDLIELFVLPEVGGKVWGAVVKKTGHEFIYRNEVLKFRNIALRGPWTSGGIEFNFGVIGHTPSTATPVDYLLRENEDGSVSCIVGAMDLPSRTQWRVEIRLPADRATFETRALWYNPTPLEQPYYNWMTAAAFARDDLELAIPGDAYLTHPGMERPWPVDARGRYLPLYRNNDFDGAKSYHVVGELNDFFGGYYLDAGYGWGHWARYEDMPGQKLWLWALSREGGIWEDLLTDSDGQYVEFQAGRLFVQYSPDGSVNPITQAGFDPLSSSSWTERWFPVEGIGGITDASAEGVMHVDVADGRVAVGVEAFADVRDTLEVWAGAHRVAASPVSLGPLEPFEASFEAPAELPLRVRLPALHLDWSSDPSPLRLARPFTTDASARPAIPEADREAFEGREALKGRWYAQARRHFGRTLELERWHRDALLGLAELEYRSGRLDAGIAAVERARQLDAYDAKANFLAGLLYEALGRPADARDAFGWAARATGYRAAAWSRLADLMIVHGDLVEAERYARLALDYDRDGVSAWEALAIVGRLRGGDGGAALAREARARLVAIDPLHAFVRTEGWLAAPSDETASALLAGMRSEYPEQTLLELAVRYSDRGLPSDAARVLSLTPRPGPVLRAWRAWLTDDPSLLDDPSALGFAFPYRSETLEVLEWATQHNRGWAWRYLLALNLWAVDRDAEALAVMAALGEEPDFAPFYAARAALAEGSAAGDPVADLRRSVRLDPDSRVLRVELVRTLQDAGDWTSALTASAEGRARFPDDFNLDLLHARSLIRAGRAGEAASILAATRVLPSESARESHLLWEQAHTLLALDALESDRAGEARAHLLQAMEWPETLGQGRPYEPEERLQRYLLGRTEERLGNPAAARAAYEAVVEATPEPSDASDRRAVLANAALAALGRGAPPEVPTAADFEGTMVRRALLLGGRR